MMPWQPTAIAGPKHAKVANPESVIRRLNKAKRPLFIIGPVLICEETCEEARDEDCEEGCDETFCNKAAIRSLCIDIAKEWDVPTVTVGHAFKSFHNKGFDTEPMGVIEIVNLLKDPKWNGLKGEGQHDLVLFIGVTYYIASQGLSTLKHFADHLTTLTLCKFYHPNADASFPNMSDKKWLKYLEKLKNTPENNEREINKEMNTTRRV